MEIVAVIADLPMRSPRPTRDAPPMMSREVPPLSHKAKRGLFFDPGKPLGCIRLEREHATLGTGHHIATRRGSILHTRDDMHRLARRFGSSSRTRVGGRRGGGTLARLVGLSLRWWARGQGCWRLEQTRKSRHLLLQGRDLSLQGVKL